MRRLRSTSLTSKRRHRWAIRARGRGRTHRREELKVACTGEIGVHRHLGRQIPYAPARLERLALTVEPENGRTAAARPQQVQQQPHRRRLAGAVGAEEAEDLAGLHLKRQRLDADDTAVVLREVVRLDGGRHRRYRPRCRASSRSAAVSTACTGSADPSPSMTMSPGPGTIENSSGATLAEGRIVRWLRLNEIAYACFRNVPRASNARML